MPKNRQRFPPLVVIYGSILFLNTIFSSLKIIMHIWIKTIKSFLGTNAQTLQRAQLSTVSASICRSESTLLPFSVNQNLCLKADDGSKGACHVSKHLIKLKRLFLLQNYWFLKFFDIANKWLILSAVTVGITDLYSPVILANAQQKICTNLNFLPMNSTYPRNIPTKFHVSKHGASLDN
jgi:hypothetical protein